MNGHIYQNLLANSPRISGRLARQPNRYFNSQFFAVWFAIFFAAFFGLYALGLVPAGVSEIGDAITYNIGFVSAGVAKAESILENGAGFVSAEIAGLSKVFPSGVSFVESNLAYAADVLKANIGEIKIPHLRWSSFTYFKKSEAKKVELTAEPAVELAAEIAAQPLPDSASAVFDNARIIIPEIDVNSPVIFPKSIDNDALNNSLLKGIVHYPGSALPGEKGSVFLFGHSTGLTIVHNKSFEIFNRLKDLRTGDIVQIQSGNQEYRYRVLSMKIAKADEAVIDLNSKEQKLVLSTCRIFGRDVKDDRFIVEAEFMGKYPVSS